MDETSLAFLAAAPSNHLAWDASQIPSRPAAAFPDTWVGSVVRRC